MKKFLSAILLITVMFTVMVLPASAADGNLSTNVSLSEDKTSFTVDLVVNNNPGVIAMTAELSYDTKALKLVSAKSGKIFENITMTSQNLTDVPYNIIWMEATAIDDIKTNGVLATYTFQVLKDAPIGQTEIEFNIKEAVGANNNDVKFNGSSFKVNVKGSGNSQNTLSSGDQNTSQVTPSLNSNESNGVQSEDTAGDRTVEVEIPDSDDAVSIIEEISSDESDVKEETTNDKDNNNNNNNNNNNSTLIIIIIAAIIVLGVGITVIALCCRKKPTENK